MATLEILVSETISVSRAVAVLATVLAFAACGGAQPPSTPPSPSSPAELRAPEAFASIADRDERAKAMFLEATKVFFHPRCINCHPAGDSPLQGDERRLHDPPVVRGPNDEGVPALACSSCHQDKNVELARVPGAPKWHLAPRSMAWVGKSADAVCEQIKDPARNGGHDLDAIVAHVTHDELVAWGWSPGHGRVPAPGSQAKFGALVAGWVAAGAACPKGEAR